MRQDHLCESLIFIYFFSLTSPLLPLLFSFLIYAFWFPCFYHLFSSSFIHLSKMMPIFNLLLCSCFLCSAVLSSFRAFHFDCNSRKCASSWTIQKTRLAREMRSEAVFPGFVECCNTLRAKLTILGDFYKHLDSPSNDLTSKTLFNIQLIDVSTPQRNRAT